MKVCCGFGHRMVYDNINDRINSAVLLAVHEGCDVFYTGAMGEFDNLFSTTVRKLRSSYPKIKLICVKPYFSQTLNANRAYYAALYDDIIIPTELLGIHYKAAIKARNRWMVEHSDIIISYTVRENGGAAEALRYAKKQNKRIIELSGI